jgi:transposase
VRTLLLTEDQWDQLESIVRSDPKPYKRERAAALLKIAAGETPAQVASIGLLVPRAEDTIYRWMDRFESDVLASLDMNTGRGRKLAFPPCVTHSG